MAKSILSLVNHPYPPTAFFIKNKGKYDLWEYYKVFPWILKAVGAVTCGSMVDMRDSTNSFLVNKVSRENLDNKKNELEIEIAEI